MKKPAAGGGPASGLHQTLAKETGFLLARLGMVAQKTSHDRLSTLGVSPRIWGLLSVLDAEGAITQHALGQCVEMNPSSIVRAIDQLEGKGLVERRRHPSDRRARELHLTDEGRDTLRRGRELARKAQDDLLKPLDSSERALLQSLLLRVALAPDGVRLLRGER